MQELVNILIVNGASGQNSRTALQRLNELKNDTSSGFFTLLVQIFKAPQIPDGLRVDVQWELVRRLAALTLKNSLKVGVDNMLLAEAAKAVYEVLSTASDEKDFHLAKNGAQILARLLSIGGMEFFTYIGLNLTEFLFTSLLQSQQRAQVVGGLFSLKYLLEDATHAIGSSSGVI